MKPFWVFCLSFFLPLFALGNNLLFVHLGEAIPPCIFTTMKQSRFLNQNSNIYLLTEGNAYHFFQKAHPEFFLEERITLVNMDLIPRTKEHLYFQEINKIDPSISQGLWVYASERFFTLFDFIKQAHLENIVHLESDSMLYVDFGELLPLFEELDLRLAAPFQSLYGCIPCFVFIKNQESLSPLIDHILSEIRDYSGTKPHIGVNDMQTLASFYRKFGGDFMRPLPTLMPDYSEHYPKKKSLFSQDNGTRLTFLSLNASLFPNYIFDAAGLGIFLNGNDPKYSPHHGPGTIHSRSLFNPGLFSYYWGKDKQDRIVPYLSFKGKNYRIVNMHFHSKMPEEYTSFRETRADLPKAKYGYSNPDVVNASLAVSRSKK